MNINTGQVTTVTLHEGVYTLSMIEKIRADMKEAEMTSLSLLWDTIQKLGLNFSKSKDNKSLTIWKKRDGQDIGITLSLSDMSYALNELLNWVQKT